ncbi:MAG TPA: DNA repair protein RecO [Beijerinckiaceae bacterium]|nr:DNA repair protein RecO [Beijerinckiaceae bacterium]
MEWRDAGLILGLRRLGETSVIVELMTPGHGRALGLVRGGRSRRMQPLLQPGNEVEAVWRARLEDQLGQFTLEGVHLRAAALLANAQALHGVNLLGALLRLLPERDPHPAVYEAAMLVLRHLEDGDIGPALMVRLELALLSELGFGLDLTCCAATGGAEDLAWVSPKSGRAVSREAGEPWRDRLLSLPEFLRRGERRTRPSSADVETGFRLTGHFLERDVFSPRGLRAPDARRAYIAAILESAA